MEDEIIVSLFEMVLKPHHFFSFSWDILRVLSRIWEGEVKIWEQKFEQFTQNTLELQVSTITQAAKLTAETQESTSARRDWRESRKYQ